MYKNFQNHLNKTLQEIRDAGLYKNERIIVSPQGVEIELETGQKVINLCANNYLGLSNNSILSKLQSRPSTITGMACRPYVSSAEQLISTKNLKGK